ncbi:uncharacterized protein J3R85_014933 [Psidium guajava]|nr:uncharacterized protein J3R85_014933 [Psidium guajava]
MERKNLVAFAVRLYPLPANRGFHMWLHFIPGIQFRTTNARFKVSQVRLPDSVLTGYDHDAPLDEYGFIRQPKWRHLRNLPKAIKLCEDHLVSAELTYVQLGSKLEVASQRTVADNSFARAANARDHRPGDGIKNMLVPRGNNSFTSRGLLEQINTMKDTRPTGKALHPRILYGSFESIRFGSRPTGTT